MEPRRRQQRDERAWRAVMERFEASGLPVARFCQREGIGASSFYYARARLKLSSPRRPKVAPADRTAPARSAFLDLGPLGAGDVRDRASHDSTARTHVRLELGDGIVIHVTRG